MPQIESNRLTKITVPSALINHPNAIVPEAMAGQRRPA